MLTQPRRVDREAVRQDRRAGTCAVTQVGMHPGAVGHAHPQAQPVVNIVVDQAAGGLRQARQAVFVIVSVGREGDLRFTRGLVATRKEKECPPATS